MTILELPCPAEMGRRRG